jgi:radical SAM superfamily enzyme YgiQ (UPF0313 family)
MNIKLVSPNVKVGTNLASSEVFKIQRVTLPLIAALTPPGHTIKIVDEDFAPDDFKGDFDLVGITVMTEHALKSYHMAEHYRQQGSKVILGGIHPTLLPEEALKHADAIVIGEAEELWPKIVSDTASGQLQKIYQADKSPSLTGYPHPKRELYPKLIYKSYTPLTIGVETSRGCPYDCEFCTVSRLTGRYYRSRPITETISEIESLDPNPIFFVDENLGLRSKMFKTFLSQLKPLRRTWVGQGTVALAEDIELVKLMYRAGCRGLLIGFESVQKEVRGRMKKSKDRTIDHSEAVRRFHGEGIPIIGAFILGFDHEDKDIFDKTFEFVMKNNVDYSQIRILTPYPGTQLFSRLLKEKRLFVPDWWLHGYSTRTVLFRPKNMTPRDLVEGYSRLNKQLHSVGKIGRRFFGIAPWKRGLNGCLAFVAFNIGQRKRYKVSLNTPQPFA